MSSESKFSYIGWIFCVIFMIINLVNFFPIRIFDVFYYTNIFNVILDTSTLLLLGLAIPKFMILRQIDLYKTQNELNIGKPENLSEEIIILKNKDNLNHRISSICVIFFSLILLLQPVCLLFVLNRNDFYASRMINAMNNNLNNRIELLNTQGYNNDDQKIKVDKKENDSITLDMTKKLKEMNQVEINNFIKSNNANKFGQIKYIVRNIFLSLIWLLAFLKLSKIKSKFS